MKALIVVDHEQEWPHDIPGAGIASARGYLTGPALSDGRCQQPSRARLADVYGTLCACLESGVLFDPSRSS
jgi:hypothetical protein